MGNITVKWSEVDAKNRDNIKATKDGQTVKFISMKGLVLVGAGHKKEYIDFAKSDDGKPYYSEGTIQVDKGGILDKGELIAHGVKTGRSEFETCLHRITKKKITYK